MARNYTLEDVELLRTKAGISYEEAVRLLDKHNGDVARALIELEKLGRLPKGTAGSTHRNEGFGEWLGRMWRLGMNTRVQVTRRNHLLVNLSVIFMLLVLCISPHLFFLSLVLVLILGCRVGIKRNGSEYAETGFREFVDNIGQNINETFSGVNFSRRREQPIKPEEPHFTQAQPEQPVEVEPKEERNNEDNNGNGSDEGYDSFTIE